MKFAVLGGDRRAAHLAALLADDGNRVNTFALERSALPRSVPRVGCLQGCLYGADWVVLPVPAQREGVLNAPLSGEELSMETLAEALWPGQVVCGGRLPEEFCRLARAQQVHTEELLRRPTFAVGNAAVTAEGALYTLMGAGEGTLWGSRVLLCGWGRIGKLLSARLRGLGAQVAVAARSAQDRSLVRSLGMEAYDYPALCGCIGGFRYVVNTVPERILGEQELCCAEEGTILLELASVPGFDAAFAENIGLHPLSAPGLPGKYAPYAAALVQREAIYEAIREREEEP